MTARPRLLLLYPGDFYSMTWGRVLPLKPHMVYLYTLLKNRFDVTVLDLENEFNRPRDEAGLQAFKTASLERIQSIPTDCLAISCWSSLNYLSALFFARAVKQERPEVRVVAGGYHPTCVPEDFMFDGSPFDAVIQGAIQQYPEFTGLENDAPAGIHELLPDYAGYPYFTGQKTLGLFLSSGCPFHCRFCMEFRKEWTVLPVETAVGHIRRLYRTIGPRYLTLFDPCFGLDRTWRRDFIKAMVREDLDLYFWMETRADLLDETDIDLLAGLKVKIDFGVDSFSPTMLEIMGKTRRPTSYLERFLTLSRACTRHGILHDAFLIFNHPGETRQTFDEFTDFFDHRVLPDLQGGYLRVKYQRFAFYPGNHIHTHRSEYEQTYGFSVTHPEWWKLPGNHYHLSRDLVPSRDEAGNAFHVPLKEAARRVKAFNARAREEDLWKRLHAFELDD